MFPLLLLLLLRFFFFFWSFFLGRGGNGGRKRLISQRCQGKGRRRDAFSRAKQRRGNRCFLSPPYGSLPGQTSRNKLLGRVSPWNLWFPHPFPFPPPPSLCFLNLIFHLALFHTCFLLSIILPSPASFPSSSHLLSFSPPTPVTQPNELVCSAAGSRPSGRPGNKNHH